jgi:hypothetical protein
VFTVDRLTDTALREAFDHCLTKEARAAARACSARARKTVAQVRDRFIREVSRLDPTGEV